MLHENGKKHRRNVDISFIQRRNDTIKNKNIRIEMGKALKMMEHVAYSSVGNSFSFSNHPSRSTNLECTLSLVGMSVMAPPVSLSHYSGSYTTRNEPLIQSKSRKNQEIKLWNNRKRKRENMKRDIQTNKQHERCLSDIDRLTLQLSDNDGHFVICNMTYLDGKIYASILKEDMIVQIWKGPLILTETTRNKEYMYSWKMGIILKIHKENLLSSISFDISYLKSPKDEKETVDKNVPPHQIRILLGVDDNVPATVDEARMLLLGEQKTVTINNDIILEVDKNTGISSWGTISTNKLI